MAYNLTGIANSTGPLQFIQLVNTELMFGWLGVMIIIMISGVMFTSFIFTTNNPRKSLATTALISFVLTLLLRAVDMVPDLMIFITLIVAAIGVAFMRRD